MSPTKTGLMFEDEYPLTEELINKYRTHDDAFEDFNPINHLTKTRDQDFTVHSEINLNHARNKSSNGVNLQDARPSPIKEDDIQNKYGIADTFLDSNADLIGQTHALINELPSNILANEEAVNYSRMLSSSLKSLTDELEKARQENRRLTSDLYVKETSMDRLHDEIKDLKIQNNDLKVEIESKGDQTLLSRERDLLRAKLIKYRNLYQDAISKNKIITTNTTPQRPPIPQSAPSPTPVTQESKDAPTPTTAIQETKDDINTPVVIQQDYNRIIPLLTELVAKVGGGSSNHDINRSREKDQINSTSELTRPNSNHNENSPSSRNKQENGEETAEKHISEKMVVNCYVYNKEAEQEKGKCQICQEDAEIEDEEAADDRDTINLIGEYKWNIEL